MLLSVSILQRLMRFVSEMYSLFPLISAGPGMNQSLRQSGSIYKGLGLEKKEEDTLKSKTWNQVLKLSVANLNLMKCFFASTENTHQSCDLVYELSGWCFSYHTLLSRLTSWRTQVPATLDTSCPASSQPARSISWAQWT